MPDIEIAPPGFVQQAQLRAGNVVLRAVHQRPERLAHAREFAREDALLQGVVMRLPPEAAKHRRAGTLDRGDAAHRFRVTESQPVPYAPDIFPALEAGAVEERVLEVLGMIARPTVAHIYHVPRFKPLVVADRS